MTATTTKPYSQVPQHAGLSGDSVSFADPGVEFAHRDNDNDFSIVEDRSLGRKLLHLKTVRCLEFNYTWSNQNSMTYRVMYSIKPGDNFSMPHHAGEYITWKLSYAENSIEIKADGKEWWGALGRKKPFHMSGVDVAWEDGWAVVTLPAFVLKNCGTVSFGFHDYDNKGSKNDVYFDYLELAPVMTGPNTKDWVSTNVRDWTTVLYQLKTEKQVISTLDTIINILSKYRGPDKNAVTTSEEKTATDEEDSITGKHSTGQLKAGIPHPDDVFESDGSPVYYVINRPFNNWGLTVKNKPAVTFTPKTKIGICNIVKWATKYKMKVRACGYSHTWTNLYTADDEVLIAMLPFGYTTVPPTKPMPSAGITGNDLQGIERVDTEVIENGEKKELFKVGAGTTNQQFRHWIVKHARDDNNKKWRSWWTYPLNVILVEVTIGGTNAPICHGGGWKTKTLSDLVRSIEFVNPLGNLQVVNDPDQLKAAAGCFGMLGIVVSVTLVLDVLTFANMKPQKQRLGLAIPPPKGLAIPHNIDMEGITEDEKKQAFQAFVKACESNYYAEFFWFVFQSDVWVNCWANNGKPQNGEDYPSEIEKRVEEVMENIAEKINELVSKFSEEYEWLAPVQAYILGWSAMFSMPDKETIVTPLPDALHFRRGVHNMRVHDMEWEIPIPGLKSNPDKPDWSIVQQAWWAVLTVFYKRYNANRDDVPLRLVMEMRITGGSDVLMAPQKGNTHGTCSLEILTPSYVPFDKWQSFMQDVTDVWLNLKDENGSYLTSRPHWAKQWQGLKVRGDDIVDYLCNDAYSTVIPKYGEQLNAVAKAGGFTLQDAEERYSNPLLRKIFKSIYHPIYHPINHPRGSI